ncbi:hypothetical protein HDV04_003778 [Boothiomyces sp. JEL0838]|nr:hypothetical protein HDV04_003778 [Boothiomyces sp. JEL0838]
MPALIPTVLESIDDAEPIAVCTIYSPPLTHIRVVKEGGWGSTSSEGLIWGPRGEGLNPTFGYDAAKAFLLSVSLNNLKISPNADLGCIYVASRHVPLFVFNSTIFVQFVDIHEMAIRD